MADGPTIHPHPPVVTDEWLAVYRELPAALLGRVIDEGFVDPEIRPLVPPSRIVGTAVTVRLPEGDIGPMFAAIDLLLPNDVLVVDAGGERHHACWGEPAALVAKARGGVGVVVDGALADVAALRELALPTFARGISALVGRALERSSGTVNAPISCGGVAVHPGDLVVADDDGVVIVPTERIVDVATEARAYAARWRASRPWLERGGSFAALDGLDAAGIERLVRERGQS